MDTGLVVYTLHAVADPPPFSEWPKPAYDLALDKSERQRTKYARVSGCCKVVTHEPTVAFWDLDKKNTNVSTLSRTLRGMRPVATYLEHRLLSALSRGPGTDVVARHPDDALDA